MKKSSFFWFVLGVFAFTLVMMGSPKVETVFAETDETPAEDISIYADGLDSSWTITQWGDGNYNLNVSAPVFSGSSSLELSIADERLTAIFVSSSVPLNPEAFQSVNFYIYGTEAGQTVEFYAWNSGSTDIAFQEIAIQQNQWTLVQLPFDSVEPGQDLESFAFRGASSAQPFYIDELTLTPKPPVGAFVAYLPLVVAP